MKKRVRIPRKNSLLKWLLAKYGYGQESYSHFQILSMLEALKLLLTVTGTLEQHFLGNLLLQLSENPNIAENLKKELDNYLKEV